MVNYSITRALVELKNLDKRIQGQIDKGVYVSFRGQFHRPSNGIENAQASFQSVNDLIELRKRIKSAIVKSNATTKVTICGQEMTVAEAIETKSSIKHKKALLGVLKTQYGEAVRNVEMINARTRQELEKKSTRDNDKDKQQMSLEEFSKQYMEMHGVELFDPIKIGQRVEELEAYITGFEKEVDYVLSEKNATTMIEV